MSRIAIILICLVFGVLLACEEKEVIPKPESLLPEDTYISIIVELQLLDALTFTNADSSFTDSIRVELFKYYEISEAQFIESNSYYQSNVGTHIARIDSAIKAIKAESTIINNLD